MITLMSTDPEKTIDELVDKSGLNADPLGWEQVIDKVVEDNSYNWRSDSDDARFRHIMGQVMSKYRGIVPGSDAGSLVLKKLHQAKQAQQD